MKIDIKKYQETQKPIRNDLLAIKAIPTIKLYTENNEKIFIDDIRKFEESPINDNFYISVALYDPILYNIFKSNAEIKKIEVQRYCRNVNMCDDVKSSEQLVLLSTYENSYYIKKFIAYQESNENTLTFDVHFERNNINI